MPVYVFRCDECEHEFSITTSWSKKGEATCPECGSSRLKEQFGQYQVAAPGGGGGGRGSMPSGGACAPGGG